MWGVLRWLHGPFQVICVLVAVSLTAALSPLRRTGRTDERCRTSQRSSSAAGCGLALTRARQSQLLIRPFATVGPQARRRATRLCVAAIAHERRRVFPNLALAGRLRTQRGNPNSLSMTIGA